MPQARLPRFLGPLVAALFAVGWTIGSAIFRVPGEVATGSGSVGTSMLLWVGGGVVAFCGALCYAELSVRLPRAGSEYAYAHAAYGPFFAFLVAWSSLFACPAGIAAVARAFADYFAAIWPLEEYGRRFLGASAIGALASVAVLSTPASTKVAAIAGVGKLLAILALAAVGLVLVNSQPATTLMNQTPFSAGHLGPAFVAIIFAYDGFQSATLLAGEVRDPKRTLPLGLLLGLGLIVLAYVGINSVYFRVLGFAGVASSDAVAAQTLAVTVGPRGSQMIAAMVMASTLGTLAAQTVGLPRYFIAPAEDGLFPSWLARLTTRASTPANAVITLAGAAMLLLIAGDYGALISVCVLVGYPLNAISLLGAVRLRLKEGPPGGFSMPLYPLPLLIFVGGIAATLAASLVGNSQTLFYALGVPASGTAVYAFQRRCKARAGHGASGA